MLFRGCWPGDAVIPAYTLGFGPEVALCETTGQSAKVGTGEREKEVEIQRGKDLHLWGHLDKQGGEDLT